MYCPQCGVEYREGFSRCSDCQVALTPGVPPQVDHYAELVPVFETRDRTAVDLATASLKAAGIPFWRQGDTGLRPLYGMLLSSCLFLVNKDNEAEARELLAPLLSPQEGEAGF